MSLERKLEEALSAILQQMEPVTLRPIAAEAEVLPSEGLTLGTEEGDFERWREIVGRRLAAASRFEIHCWNEEAEWIALAERFGQRREDPWPYGVIVDGEVTEAFAEMVLSQPRPADQEVTRKLTPFFNLFLDANFQSCHYGTELYVIGEGETF